MPVLKPCRHSRSTRAAAGMQVCLQALLQLALGQNQNVAPATPQTCSTHFEHWAGQMTAQLASRTSFDLPSSVSVFLRATPDTKVARPSNTARQLVTPLPIAAPANASVALRSEFTLQFRVVSKLRKMTCIYVGNYIFLLALRLGRPLSDLQPPKMLLNDMREQV